MKTRIIIITFIIISIILFIAFIINLLFIKKINNKKLLMIIYIPLVVIVLSFFMYAYAPRKINRKYLKDDPIKIYCYDPSEETDIKAQLIDMTKKDDLIKMIKKVYYVPCHQVIIDKTERAPRRYFCLQYEDYYVVISQYSWQKIDGIYTNTNINPPTYALSQKEQGATAKSMHYFDFEEWKKMFVE